MTTYFLIAATLGVLAAMVMALVRAFKGPTIHDRALAGNTFGTLTVLLICLHGFLFGRPEFLDIAMVYALINFIGTIAVLKYFRFKSLGTSGEDEGGI